MFEIFDEAAEQSYLGCILYESELVHDVGIKPEHLYLYEHKVILETLLDMVAKEKPIDLMTITMELGNEKLGAIADRRGNGYVNKLALSVPSVVGFKTFEKKILETWKAREGKKAVREIYEAVHAESTETVLSRVASKLDNLIDYGVEKADTFKESLYKIYERIESGVAQWGIRTHYTELDRMTFGWQNTDLIIIGARPSVGKTAFVINQINKMLQKSNDVAVHFFSLEMAEEKILERFICTLGTIDINRFRTATLSDEEYGRFTIAMGQLETFKNSGRLNIYDDSFTTPREIRSKVRKSKREHPNMKHIVFIDYLTIMGYEGNEERPDLKVTDNTNQLKAIAKQLKIPVVALAQLSRGVESRADKRPVMADLRESGGIEQIADVIGMLYRDDYYDAQSENRNIIEIIIGKQRNGAVGTVQLAFVKEYGIFANLERRLD